MISLSGCSDDDDQSELSATGISGTWLLTETYIYEPDNQGHWVPTENGYTYTFNSDGTFSSTRFFECTTGEYSMSKNQLILTYDCKGFDTGIEDKAGTFIENYHLENGKIILTPTYLNCDEGCGFKFEKIE